ncbi:ATP-binding protein [Alkalihalobacillus deserti]|uniref:ATP-binding protein n=1 Tax=Alkalihalobacillus deserti TaxID=2879466 RepID=UPI001D148688|nr:ATP-binding protein [Alkalihalobacillus deserti]
MVLSIEKTRKQAIFMSVIYSIIYYLWIITGSSGGSSLILGGILGVVGPLLAVLILLYSIKMKTSKVERTFWSLILIACFTYLVAEIIWRYSIVFLGTGYSFPGYADLFYIMFVFIYAGSLIYKVSATWNGKFSKSIQFFLDAFIFMTVITTVCWSYFIKPILMNKSVSTFEFFLFLGYPVALLGVLLGIILILSSKPLFSPVVLSLNLVGVLMYIIADFIYLYQSIYASYQHFSFFTPMWNICLLLIAISSLFNNNPCSEEKHLNGHEKIKLYQRASMRRIVFPYLSIGIFLILFFIKKDDELTSILIGGSVVLLLLVIRQIITLKENDQLLKRVTKKTIELEKLKNDLIESEKRHKSLMDYHPYAIIFIDKQGNIFLANGACEKILGYPQHQIINSHYLDIIKEFKADDQLVLYFRSALKGVPKTFETTIVNGMENTIDLNLTYIPSIVNDQVVGVFVMGEDVTKKKKTEELILKSEKLSVASRLAAGVAHEIRNPLTSIKGFLQMMNESSTINSKYMGIVISELNRVEIIIREFLNLAKPHHENSFELQSIATILREVTDLLRTNSILENIEITLKVEEDLPLINCLENQLKQVFINVIQNAVEATGNNGHVLVRVKKEGEKDVSVHVIDGGNGIPQERLHRLGEPFYSTKEKGTGIGLMVCYKIIEQHQGNIKILSEKNVGTTIEINLPINHSEKQKQVSV